MKLVVDTQGKTFTVTKAAVEKQDQNGRQKQDRITNEPLWTVQVMALDETGGEMLNVTVAGQMPKVTVGQPSDKGTLPSVLPVSSEPCTPTCASASRARMTNG